MKEAWGHHACGTCKIGKDDDPDAVLDGDFRVRGVKNLRVVDASVFPKIPGYFIVTPTYMVSERRRTSSGKTRDEAMKSDLDAAAGEYEIEGEAEILDRYVALFKRHFAKNSDTNGELSRTDNAPETSPLLTT